MNILSSVFCHLQLFNDQWIDSQGLIQDQSLIGLLFWIFIALKCLMKWKILGN